jgi:hypothetical protein
MRKPTGSRREEAERAIYRFCVARGTYTDSGAPDEGRRVEAEAERSMLMHSDVAVRSERDGERELWDVP